MPVHGMDTANFLVKRDGNEFVMVIHNCLLCHGETTFNLISVSQMLRSTANSIVFKEGGSMMTLKQKNKELTISLREEEGLYGIESQPIGVNDVTPNHDPNYLMRPIRRNRGAWVSKLLPY